MMTSTHVTRHFRDLSDAEIADIEQANLLVDLGWRGATTWDDLLKSSRVLIISEAGAGKTHECRVQHQKLWDAGEAAFLIELAELAKAEWSSFRSIDESGRLAQWKAAQSETATFFLDSIDELKLTQGSFKTALTRLANELAGQMTRVRVIVTSRPVAFDRQVFGQSFPLPSASDVADENTFADTMLGKHGDKSNEAVVPLARTVGLMSLNDEQILGVAATQLVSDPPAFLAAIHARAMRDFARRPQDIVELAAMWNEHHRFGTHREQIDADISIKLRPRAEGKEPADISPARAEDGARRLALAALLTRKLTIRYSSDATAEGQPDTALDPSAVLFDWSDAERQTLLQRALFGFASYGRVRFHHRSVIEVLAAKRIGDLLQQGMPRRAIARLLFATTAQGTPVVRPSMRAVAAWLALDVDWVFDQVRDREPEVLLDLGDPETLSLARRTDALRRYVARYGPGDWQGRHVPRIQVARFADQVLAPTVVALFGLGIENAEVRHLLLGLIAAGRMTSCADIAHAVAIDPAAETIERILAIDALISIADPRVEEIGAAIAAGDPAWPDDLARTATLRLFPDQMSADRLCSILARISETRSTGSGIAWNLPRIIQNSNFDDTALSSLREGLTKLVDASVRFDPAPHCAVTDYPHLVSSLALVCALQLSASTMPLTGAQAITLAVRLEREPRSDDLPSDMLVRALTEATPAMREAVFRADATLVMRLRPDRDPWNLYYEIAVRGGVVPNANDDAWVSRILADINESDDMRAVMLEVAMNRPLAEGIDYRDHIRLLKPVVADSATLTARIDARLQPATNTRELRRMNVCNARRKKKWERRNAKARASWIIFWRKIAQDPDAAFASDEAGNTVWNLWEAMKRSGDSSRESDWNRRMIETQFGKETADRLRLAMMPKWRADNPSLQSERAEGKKNTYLVRWTLGLAAISAEAEDPHWATNLLAGEPERAARYAPLAFNGFPSWLDSLAAAHPEVVGRVLGGELDFDLSGPAIAHGVSFLLQNIAGASPPLARLFVARLVSWLDAQDGKVREGDEPAAAAARLERVIGVVVDFGTGEQISHVSTQAKAALANGIETPFARVWLPVLLKLDPTAGVDVLENGLSTNLPEKSDEAVGWIANLFGDRFNRYSTVNLSAPGFTPDLLLRLVRLAYRYVDRTNDAHHEGSYTPDTRDEAERGRGQILEALLSLKGSDGWAAKLTLAADPLLAHLRDRIGALALETAAIEVDGPAITENEVARIGSTCETAPRIRDQMFDLLTDRIDDLQELLLEDVSPREAWALISDERMMRREIARSLKAAARNAYNVDQEAATADEKETDIRLRSTAADQQAVIELKIGEKDRSARDLRDTLADQLVTKYLAADNCRAGCLMITISSDRHWTHPDTAVSLDFAGLITFLGEEADAIMTRMPGALRLTVCGLDLRARLPTERAGARRSRSEPSIV